MKNKLIQALARTVIFAACAAAVVMFGMTGIYPYLENRIFDGFFHLRDACIPPSVSETPITIVAIDRRTLDTYKSPVIFWDREFSDTIGAIASAGPRVIGFDVLHLARSDASRSEALKQDLKSAILKTKNIVLPYSSATGDIPVYILRHLESTIGLSESAAPADRISLLAIAEQATGIGFGFVEVPEDDDGVVRRASPLGSSGTGASLPLKIFMRYHGITMDDVSIRGDRLHIGRYIAPLERGALIINFPGPPGTIPAVSMAEVIARKKDASYLARHFRNRAVLIGVWDPVLMDVHSTPYVSSSRGTTRGMYGVEVIAGVLDTMLRERYLRQSGIVVSVIMCLLFAAGGMLLSRVRPLRGVIILLAAEAAYLGLAFILFTFARYEIAVTMPLLALPVTFTAGYLLEHYLLGKDKVLLQNVLRSYLDPRVVERVIRSGDTGILDGRRREITVLFADIRNFTGLSETMSRPEDVVEILNIYLPTMCDIILASEGCVDKFIGDGIMAFWNAPNDVDGHAARAVRCALDMQARMDSVNDILKEKGLVPEGLKIGIGIHTGTAVVGNIGGRAKNDYTAIGDTVNLASRLEGKSKDYRYNIIISDSVKSRIGDTGIAVKSIGRIEVKGKKNRVQIYGVRG